MIYVDTSAIVKLYIKEPDSAMVSDWVKNNNEPIPLSGLIELEFINALKLKQFRDELNTDEFEKLISLLYEHERRGVYYRPTMDWPGVFSLAFSLSKNHTPDCGARSLDILHVGSALTMKAETFLTFDVRQMQLANQTGLKTIELTSI